MTKLRIAHVTRMLSPRTGGLARSVPGLARAQSHAGHDVVVSAAQDPHASTQLAVHDVDVHIKRSRRSGEFLYAPGLLKDVLNWRPDIIHSHGLWSYSAYVAHSVSRQMGVPHVCAPRGMLDDWAFHHHGLRKRAIAGLFQRRALDKVRCFHALAASEREAIQGHGFPQPVATVPNGVDGELLRIERSRVNFDQRYPALQGSRIALFLSRIHPKKGVPHLIQAWSMLGNATHGWHLVIAGPDELGHAAEVRNSIERAGLSESVSLLGMQVGAQVWDCYGAADLFVLPSFSEGFSMAILEALALGTPVCITKGCHFPEVGPAGCGVICDPDPESISDTLARLVARSPEELGHMGARGRVFIRDDYTFDQRALELLDVYAWLRDPTLSVPECVTLSEATWPELGPQNRDSAVSSIDSGPEWDASTLAKRR